jgi:hypothetical protein
MRGGAAGTALLFVVGLIVLLVSALRSPGPASVRLGVRAGIVVLLVGCLIGLVMVSNNSGVYHGSIGSGFGNRANAYLGPTSAVVGPEYLLIRPATQGGDLVLLHAIGVHGLVLLAAPAVLLARTMLAPTRQLRLVGAMVASVAVAMTILLVQALLQLSLGQLHPMALAMLGVCGLSLLVAGTGTAWALLVAGRTPTRAAVPV